MERARRAVGRRVPQRGRRGRVGRESAEGPLDRIVGGVGIHGTAAEYSIGTRASHGCIRMRVADVVDLYPRVPSAGPS